MKYMIVGNGYLGSQFASYLGGFIQDAKIRTQADADVVLRAYQPEYIINCAGKTGVPNIDWCESHQEETFFANVVLPSYLLNACKRCGVKMVHLGSGCTYRGHNNWKGFIEEHPPNFDKSFYSWTKVVSERLLDQPDVLQIRIRMPISGEKHPRNLLTKLISYKTVLECENSVTCLPDLLCATKKLIEKNATGIYNIVNSGWITHPVILGLYEELSGKTLKYDVISADDLDRMTIAPRSNCVLSCRKLESLGIYMPKAADSIRQCIKSYIAQEVKETETVAEEV